MAEGDRHRRREVEHVDRAAAPHLAVDQLAAERVVAPAVRADGHDVGVAHQAQRRRRRVGALDPRHHRRPPGARLVAGDVESGPLEERLQHVGVARLEARVGAAVVDAFVADQRLQQLGRLAGQRVGGHRATVRSRRSARHTRLPVRALAGSRSAAYTRSHARLHWSHRCDHHGRRGRARRRRCCQAVAARADPDPGSPRSARHPPPLSRAVIRRRAKPVPTVRLARARRSHSSRPSSGGEQVRAGEQRPQHGATTGRATPPSSTWAYSRRTAVA